MVVLVLLAAGAAILDGAGGKALCTTENGAIDGYDPVAYFTEGKPVEGSASIGLEWGGGTWRFSSEANRHAFESDPEKYAPQYGGYCAYGMSEGYLAQTDPAAWTIVDGKLYLNFDAGVMERWRETKERRIPRADANWTRQ